MPDTPCLYNLGSINIDWVYRLASIVAPGQTLDSTHRNRFAGGKGANQSVAAARAGACVVHMGGVGADGQWLIDLLAECGVNTQHIGVDPEHATGHAIIQVDDAGENAIVLYPGANHALPLSAIAEVLHAAQANASPVSNTLQPHWLLTQNETNHVAEVLALANASGWHTVWNPAPMNAAAHDVPLELLDLLIVNEQEATALAAVATPQGALAKLVKRVGGTVVVTLGAQGAIAQAPGESMICVPAPRVQAVDTTGAGDTFIGYLIASLMQGDALKPTLMRATQAAALAVTRPGAIPAIPTRDRVCSALAADSGA